MIKAAYRKFSKHLRVVLLLFVLATILTFFIPNDSPLWISIFMIFAFALPLVLIVRFISKVEAFRKLLNSLSLDERKEVEDAFHSENNLGDIYVTRHFIVLHQCLHFNAVTLTIIKRANIDSVELFHNTPPQPYQYVQIKTNDSKNVYRVEYPFFQISEKQLVNFIDGNSDGQETILDAVYTKFKISADFIQGMIIFGLLMTCLIGMLFKTGYIPKSESIEQILNTSITSISKNGLSDLISMKDLKKLYGVRNVNDLAREIHANPKILAKKFMEEARKNNTIPTLNVPELTDAILKALTNELASEEYDKVKQISLERYDEIMEAEYEKYFASLTIEELEELLN